MNLTPLETKVLGALYESSKSNGHDFGLIEDARSAVASPRELAGVVSSLVKKGIITVHDKINGWTQFTFEDFPTVETWHATMYPIRPYQRIDIKSILADPNQRIVLLYGMGKAIREVGMDETLPIKEDDENAV